MEPWATDNIYPHNDFGKTICLQLMFLPESSNLRYTMPLVFYRKRSCFLFEQNSWHPQVQVLLLEVDQWSRSTLPCLSTVGSHNRLINISHKAGPPS
ncbi:hypothetical protein PoB_006276300 [Plakobranchus ocellatus]|uniref:UBC core domain-containing protein n=1 Tax=Plakobranchus ocellatus TaxID=259542 RepID=A0AAV4CWJ0_9GAST|nr:hypothetical protein PoB_006276300 [Plakobranchus ocellatus]